MFLRQEEKEPGGRGGEGGGRREGERECGKEEEGEEEIEGEGRSGEGRREVREGVVGGEKGKNTPT